MMDTYGIIFSMTPWFDHISYELSVIGVQYLAYLAMAQNQKQGTVQQSDWMFFETRQ